MAEHGNHFSQRLAKMDDLVRNAAEGRVRAVRSEGIATSPSRTLSICAPNRQTTTHLRRIVSTSRVINHV